MSGSTSAQDATIPGWTEFAESVRALPARLLAKLGARDRVQLVIIAYELGLVRPSG